MVAFKLVYMLRHVDETQMSQCISSLSCGSPPPPLLGTALRSYATYMMSPLAIGGRGASIGISGMGGGRVGVCVGGSGGPKA